MKKTFTIKIQICLMAFLLIAPQILNAQGQTRSSSASYPELVTFTSSQNSVSGLVYEVMPGPAVLNPMMDPTPFSDSTIAITGSYSFTVADIDSEDSPFSQDSVVSANIVFTANNGQKLKIDQINIIHKPADMGDHTFFGGVGLNKMMHGNTMVGTDLMPKMLSYITLWGLCDLKDFETDTVVAAMRIIHVMTSTRVRDDSLHLDTNVVMDASNHHIYKAETHIILPPLDMEGNMSPVPGTDHGFLHIMFEDVELGNASRDWTLVYEILPGPAVLMPIMNPTPFSNNIAIGGGSYSLDVVDRDSVDSMNSRDSVNSFNLNFKRADGTDFMIDNIMIIHKPENMGDHTFYGGVGFNKLMHGNTMVGTNMMPKLESYITLWGLCDLKDGSGNVLASGRIIHIMAASRVRNESLALDTNTVIDNSDHSLSMVETHIILPPLDMEGNMDPVPGTGHGFLHLMFEKVVLSEISTSVNEFLSANEFISISNYPNPFNEKTVITYDIPKHSNVRLKVYDILGNEIITLVNEFQDAGLHRIELNASYLGIPNGVYFYHIKTDYYQKGGRMILAK